MFPSLSVADRQTVIARLSALPATDLRAILRSMQGTQSRNRKSVEWIVAETESTGGGRLQSRLPDDQLAAFLVDTAGIELLSNKDVRLRLVRQAFPDQLEQLHDYPSSTRGRGGHESRVKAIAERKWHPGKNWARHFVRVLNLPPVFAGFPGAPSEPLLEQVEPFRPLNPLQDFQEELKKEVLGVLRSQPGANRGILTLPTGAGKTRTAVEALSELLLEAEERVTLLWIAQSEELCEQAVQSFREVWIDLGHRKEVRAPLSIQRLWGNRQLDEPLPGVIVASIQKLEHLSEEGGPSSFLESLAPSLGAIIVDEAHRMLAPSYGQVLNSLGIDPSGIKPSPIPILGLTATPFRSQAEESARLASRFRQRLLRATSLGDDPERVLLERRILSRAARKVLEHKGQALSIANDPHYQTFKDLPSNVLETLGQDRERNRLLLKALLELPPEWPVLFFGCSVEHATAISVLLRRQGRSAATVISETAPSTRRFLIEEFRAGRISVLCNYGVLTTGFDAPRVRALVVARPTASMVLYQQMIGRGLRGPVFGGTEECLIIDVADNLDIASQLAFRRYVEYWRG